MDLPRSRDNRSGIGFGPAACEHALECTPYKIRASNSGCGCFARSERILGIRYKTAVVVERSIVAAAPERIQERR